MVVLIYIRYHIWWSVITRPTFIQSKPVFACGAKFVPCRIPEEISAGSGGHSKTFTVSTFASVLISCLNYSFSRNYWLSFRSVSNSNWSLQLNFTQIKPIRTRYPGIKSLNFNKSDSFNRFQINYPSNSTSFNRVHSGLKLRSSFRYPDSISSLRPGQAGFVSPKGTLYYYFRYYR